MQSKIPVTQVLHLGRYRFVRSVKYQCMNAMIMGNAWIITVVVLSERMLMNNDSFMRAQLFYVCVVMLHGHTKDHYLFVFTVT